MAQFTMNWRRPSRRTVLLGAAASGLAVGNLGLAGSRGQGAAEAVRRGGTIVRAGWNVATTLDPHLSSSRLADFSLIFDSFFHYRRKANVFVIEPGLAVGYESTSPLSAEMKLRQGVVFHDGSAWNADVAKWNIERARGHTKSTVAPTVAGIQDVLVKDAHTLELKFKSPQPLLQMQLTAANPSNVYVVSKTAVETMGEAAFGRAPVGSGPFKVDRWVVDDRAFLSAFPRHWEMGVDGKPLPYVDAYVLRFIPDQSVAALELRAGNVHIAQPPEQDVDGLAKQPGVQIYSEPLKDTGQPSFYFSSSKNSTSPFSRDVRLRRAVQHAINRDAMAEALGFGRGAAHYYWGWYPGMPGYDETLPRYQYDPAMSKRLLSEAGAARNLSLAVKVINRPKDVQPLEMMQGMLADVGVTLNILTMDRTPWVDSGTTGNFEALSHGNSSNLDVLLRQESKTGSSSNWAGYSNPKVDGLWDAAALEGDTSKRADIYRQMQRIIYEDAFHLIGFRAPLLMAHSSKIAGMETEYNYRYLSLK